MGGSSAPDPDPRIGEAALRTAAIGEDYLGWMKGQAKTTNAWAGEDRTRYKEVFEPLQDKFIAEAEGYDTPERRAAAASAAGADVRTAMAGQRGATAREMTRMGVDPRSGRYGEAQSRQETAGALAEVGAGNLEKRRIETEGRGLRVSAVNMGSGFAVNPATSIGLSNSGMGSGASSAMGGNTQMSSILQGQDTAKMQAWQQDQAAGAGMWGALGTVAGMMPWGALSSKEAKTDKREAPGILDSLKDVPVEKWRYKPGMADEGEHVGPYAEDFQKATGLGDGKTINMMDAVGITMGAVKELDAKLDKAIGIRKAAA